MRTTTLSWSKRWTLAALLGIGCGIASAKGPVNGPQTIEGLGTLEFPTSTRSPEAQTAFVRGMLLLHLYEYPAAEKAFKRAQQLDPAFVMAYWGEAMTATWPIWNRDNPAKGRAALAALAPTPQARAAMARTPRERAWLDAAEQLYGPGALHERDSAFLHAMERIARDYPNDDEAQLFLAQALLGASRGERNIDNYLKAADIAKRVLAHNPRHPGAAHYWIHGMDDPAHAAGALPAAEALAKIAPAAGHAQHMVSHITIALGRWDEVALANERSRDVSLASMRDSGKPRVACFHPVEWLQYSYYQLGRYRDAQRVLDDCANQGTEGLTWYRVHPDQSPGMARTHEAFERRLDDSLIRMRLVAVIEDERARSANAQLALRTASVGRYAGWDAFERGWTAAAQCDLPGARAELAHLRAIAQEPPGNDEFDHMGDYLAVLEGLLAAAVADGEGRHDDAIAAARTAAAQCDAIPFDFGPPVTVKPPHEYAGELLLKAGRNDEAHAEFDRALQDAPRRALSLLGRARALKAGGHTAEAARTYAELAQIWLHADADLAALPEVRTGAGTSAAQR